MQFKSVRFDCMQARQRVLRFTLKPHLVSPGQIEFSNTIKNKHKRNYIH